MATDRQIAANRANALKGGVKTPEGKAVSRLNARKHGIFASVLTEQDVQELRGIEDELTADLKPVGIVEEILVEKLAATYLRRQRCALAEADHHRRCSMMPGFQPFRWNETFFAIGLYDMRLTNQFLKLLRELERRQKARTAPGGEPQISQIAQIPSQEARPGKPANAPATGENPGNANSQNEPISTANGPDKNLAPPSLDGTQGRFERPRGKCEKRTHFRRSAPARG